MQPVGGRRRRDDDEDRLAGLDQRDRTVLELARGEALRVDIGDLLELQRALERDGEAHVTAEEEHRAGVGHEPGDLADPVHRVEQVAELVRHLAQLMGDLGDLLLAQRAAQLGKVKTEDV